MCYTGCYLPWFWYLYKYDLACYNSYLFVIFSAKYMNLMEEVKNSLAEWVEEYTNDLYSWALYKLSNKELAQDIVQDTFLAAAEKLSSFKGDSKPKTWLFSILNYKIIDVYRKKVKRNITVDGDIISNLFNSNGDWNSYYNVAWDDDGNLLDDIDFRNVLERCVDNLPDKWRLSVKLKYLQEESGEKICKDLDISPTNFWQIIHRAKLQLRECVKSNWFNV